MANPWRFRNSKNGPLASAEYNQKWDRGCYGCIESGRISIENSRIKGLEIRYCKKSVKNFPNLDMSSCVHFVKARVKK